MMIFKIKIESSKNKGYMRGWRGGRVGDVRVEGGRGSKGLGREEKVKLPKAGGEGREGVERNGMRD